MKVCKSQLIAHIRAVARQLSGLNVESEDDGDWYGIRVEPEGSLSMAVSAGAGEATHVPLDTTLEQLTGTELAKLLEACAEQGLPLPAGATQN